MFHLPFSSYPGLTLGVLAENGKRLLPSPGRMRTLPAPAARRISATSAEHPQEPDVTANSMFRRERAEEFTSSIHLLVLSDLFFRSGPQTLRSAAPPRRRRFVWGGVCGRRGGPRLAPGPPDRTGTGTGAGTRARAAVRTTLKKIYRNKAFTFMYYVQP